MLSFRSAEDDYDEEERQIQEAISASLAAPAPETPPDAHGANRTEYHTPPRSQPGMKGKKTRGGRSSKPLQTANRG